MPNKFSRTEIVDGQPQVTLFATGVACLTRQIEMLDELALNNASCAEIAGPAKTAKEALRVLEQRVKKPKTRTNVAADEAA